MTGSATAPTPTPHEAMRDAQDRRFEREGIPMVLALFDEQDPDGLLEPAGEEVALTEGRAYAELADDFREQLFPQERDGDLWPTIVVLQALSYAHLHPEARLVQSAARSPVAPAPTAPAPTAPAPTAPAPTAPNSRQSFRAHRDAFARGQFVRAVNWHNTPESAAPALRRQLVELAREFSFVGLDDLDRFYRTGRWELPRPGLVPVFYEGYRNNAEVVAPILDDLGLTGWFFICTGFLDTPPALQEAYCRAHHIGLVPEDVDGRPIAMTWNQVRDLSVRHVVNPHTANHESVGWIRDPDDVEREILQPKRRMDAVTGQSSACFAWLEGTHYGHDAVNDDAVRRGGYRYVFSNTMIQRLPAPLSGSAV